MVQIHLQELIPRDELDLQARGLQAGYKTFYCHVGVKLLHMDVHFLTVNFISSFPSIVTNYALCSCKYTSVIV